MQHAVTSAHELRTQFAFGNLDEASLSLSIRTIGVLHAAGVTFTEAAQALATWGQTTVEDWAVLSVDNEAHHAPGVWRCGELLPLESSHRVIVEAIADGTPVVVGVANTSAFRRYTSRDEVRSLPVPATWKGHPLHVVTGVGVDEESGFVIVRNSWGTGWGNNGYGYMSAAFVAHGVSETYAVTQSWLRGEATIQ